MNESGMGAKLKKFLIGSLAGDRNAALSVEVIGTGLDGVAGFNCRVGRACRLGSEFLVLRLWSINFVTTDTYLSSVSRISKAVSTKLSSPSPPKT